MDDTAKAYEGNDITITYSARRCIHAAECVRGLGAVFDPKRRPWIGPDAAPADEVAEVILRCPSGALRFQRKDSGAEEAVPDANTVTVSPNGPLYLRGDLDVKLSDGSTHTDTRVALCRCGASENKPFCDNSHLKIEFNNGAVFQKVMVKSAEDDAGGPLTVRPSRNGPYLLQGPFELIGAEASVHGGRTALCRCGGSANKPFCDGTHNKIGFSG